MYISTFMVQQNSIDYFERRNISKNSKVKDQTIYDVRNIVGKHKTKRQEEGTGASAGIYDFRRYVWKFHSHFLFFFFIYTRYNMDL